MGEDKEGCGHDCGCGHEHGHANRMSVEDVVMQTSFCLNALIELMIDKELISKDGFEKKIMELAEKQHAAQAAMQEAAKGAEEKEAPAEEEKSD